MVSSEGTSATHDATSSHSGAHAGGGRLQQTIASEAVDTEDLLAQIKRLQKRSKDLEDVVNAKGALQPLAMCGYLYKYRPFCQTQLFQATWEKRFFAVHGCVLSYFRSERDTAAHPRGRFNLKGNVLEREGQKKGRYWAFHILSPDPDCQKIMLRVSTEDESDYMRWVGALVEAGCRERQLSPEDRSREPLPSADIRWISKGGAESRGGAPELRNRWNVDSSRQERMGTSASMAEDTSEGAASEAGVMRVPLKHENRAQRRQPMTSSTPLHKASRASLLSAERFDFEQQTGLVTLALVLVLASNLRLLIENFLKYGWLLGKGVFVKGILRSALAPADEPLLVACWLAIFVLCFMALGWEWLGAQRVMHLKMIKAKANKDLNPGQAKRKRLEQGRALEWVMFPVNFVLINLVLFIPCYVITVTAAEPLPAAPLCFAAVITWMKLISFAMANYDFRQARLAGETRPGERGTPEADAMDGVAPSEQLQYPENLEITNMLYFLAAPTLIYQMTYPRSARFRTRWLVWNIAKLMMCLALMLFLIEQYVEPTIRNTKPSYDSGDWFRVIERILKLAIPSLYLWLCIFYTLFHVWLNIVAEIMSFGDREFYKDWWNAVTIGDYWRMWNMPVHKWMLRTVYHWGMSWGLSKHTAGVLVFFVSAVGHELLVGVPLRMAKVPFWSFWGIMGQVPMLYLTEYLHRRIHSEKIGNLFFWLSFCIFGQPFAMLSYYCAYVDKMSGGA